jgi:two-component system phosphate regulon sensor histidine kinase PhoR
MEKRIKFLFMLTIAASVAVIAAQSYWLFKQYLYLLQQNENELFTKTLAVAEADRTLRSKSKNRNLHVITRIKMNLEQSSNSTPEFQTRWNFEIYIINNEDVTITKPIPIQYDSLYIDSLYKSGAEIKKYQFETNPSDYKHDIYDALDRFLINEKCPFTVGRLDSLLRINELIPIAIQVETTDSTVWSPGRINYTSIFHPTMEVTYPFNVFQQQQFRVSYRLNALAIFEKMLLPFICSLIFSFFLIFCLIYQINTIFRQQRIDEFRKSFIYTMIHELKRPVATLKMCISFMKNDKMMTDEAMKKDIIRSSTNELDNLSSYFSKLRDLTYGDLEEIPLNVSTFSFKEAVDECIDKQNLPTDRQINIKTYFDTDNTDMMADRMHIVNIFCNLLENAVKYSEGETSILIDCRSIGDKYRIEVSDNGFGIPSDEHAHVFEKYFRSTNVEDKNIPGIGLGLCYVKLLVAAHRGTISLKSKLGEGSTFTIEIPKKQ